MSLYDTHFVGFAENDLGNIMQNKTTASLYFSSNTVNITKKQIVYPQPAIIKESDIIPIMNGSAQNGDQRFTFGPMIQNRTVVVNNTTTSNTLAFSNDEFNFYGLITNLSGAGQLTNALYNGSMWVCITSDVSTNNIGYSYDGITWTINSNSTGTGFLSIYWINNMWLIGGYNTSGGTAASILYSYDGINWTGISSSASLIPRVCNIQSNGHIILAVGSNASGNATYMAYSYDGLTWKTAPNTSLTALITGSINDVIWNGSIWLAVGQGTNSIAYTTDPQGLTRWVSVGNGSVSSAIYDCIWNGTIFVAVGSSSSYSSTVYYSYNGISWTKTTNLFSGSARSVSWNGKKFIVGGPNGSSSLAYSYDGIRWNSITNALFTGSTTGICAKFNSARPHSITFQRNMVIAGCSIGGNTMAYSFDGLKWNGILQTVLSNHINTAAYNGRIWVAGGPSGTGNTLATSSNGLAWNGLGATLFSQSCNSIIWDATASIWVAGGSGTNNLAYSYDGLTWIPVISPFSGCYGIASYNGKFVSVGLSNNSVSGNTISTSSDGINWTGLGNQMLTSIGLGVATNGTLWVAVGQTTYFTGSIIYSYDSVYWSETNSNGIFSSTVNAVAWNGSIWVAVGSGNNSTAYSYDGLNWFSGTNIFPNGATNVIWNGSVWIVTGTPSGISLISGMAYSYDGINWQSNTSTSEFLYAYGMGSNYNVQPKPYIQHPTLAFGAGTNSIAYSPDGINWTGLGATVFSTAGRKGFWNGKMWVAAGSGTNSLAYSYDGITWYGLGTSILTTATGVCYNGKIWVAAGYTAATGSKIAYSTNGTLWKGVSGSANIFTGTGGYGVSWNGSTFLVSGQGGNAFATSPNGITWTPVSSATTYATAGTNYSATNGYLWIATVNSNVGLIYTYDITGQTGWTPVAISPFSTAGYSVTWNGQIWVAVGSGTYNVAYSVNGISWTGITLPSAIWDICWTGSRFVVTGTSYMAYSTNGITWISNNITNIFPSNGYGVASNSGVGAFIAPSALNLNTSGISGNGIVSGTQTLDVVASDPYYQTGFDNVSISITPTYPSMYSINSNLKTAVANNVEPANQIRTYIATGNFSSTIVNGNTIVSFLSGTGSIQFSNSTSTNALVVGGGGGGGYEVSSGYEGGGGGGAGSVGYGSLYLYASQNYTITVGSGGNGGIYSTTTPSQTGGYSSIIGININEIAFGGGGGGSGNYTPNLANGLNGGSGGGASGYASTHVGGKPIYGVGTLNYIGNSGGSSSRWYSGAGGGGATIAGANGTNISGSGAGGTGYTWFINSAMYGGGGGGGSGYYNTYLIGASGFGGSGGGGSGGNANLTTPTSGLSGTANTGGGGGGAGGSPPSTTGTNGGTGGSGIVSLAFQFSPTTILPPTTGLGFYLAFNSLTVPSADSYSNALTVNGTVSIVSDLTRGNVLCTLSTSSSLSTVFATSSSFSRTFWYRPIILGSYSNTVSTLNLPIAYNGGDYISATFNYTGSPTVITDQTSIKGVKNWIHYALTYNPLSTTASLYANGALVAQNKTITFSGDVGTINNGGLCIGDYNASGKGAVAYYDKIRAYNRELTAVEVAAIYNYEFISSVIPTNDLVFYLKFGSSSLPTIDSYGNTLTANGTIIMLENVRGYVADMSGSSFSTTVGTNTSFTRSFWYNPSLISGPMNTVSSKNMKMHFNGTNYMTATFNVTGTPVSISDTVNRGISVWTHYAVTYNAYTSTATLYVNGSSVATNSTIVYVGEAGTINNGGLCIGDYNNTGAGVTGGGNATFDSIRQYNIALTSAQISTIYYSEYIYTGLTFSISFNSVSVPTTDLCGNSLTNNGTVSTAYDYIAGYVGYMSTISSSLSTALSTPASFTRTFWYNPRSITGQMNTLSSKNLKMYFNGTNYMTATFNVTGTPVSLTDTVVRLVNTWTHYVLTYNAATTTATLYVNGAQVATNSSVVYVGETGVLNNGGLCIGDYNATGAGGNAYFENIHCYNRAISAYEVINMYNQEYIGPPVPTTGLQFALGFGSSSVPTADTYGFSLTNNNSITMYNDITRGYVPNMSAVNKSFSTTYATPASFTRAFWYYPTTVTGVMNTLTSKNLKMYYNSTNYMTVLFNVVSGTQATLVDTTARSTGWTHYVLTYNATTTTAILYVNGGQVAVNTNVVYAGETGTINNGGLCIGDYNATGVGSVAYFDKIRCYNRAITVAEVASMYTYEYIPFPSSITSNANISTTSGGYSILVFTGTSGTVNITSFPTTTFNYLCVAGGGGGSFGVGQSFSSTSGAGGGGGGGVLQGSFEISGTNTISVTVGAGGDGGYYATRPISAKNGSNSIIQYPTGTLTAYGGGGGGSQSQPGFSGGCGGGGGGRNNNNGGAGIAGQGYNGGGGFYSSGRGLGGGGGGAGGAGGVGTRQVRAGNGGNGIQCTQIGVSSYMSGYYGGGGGGGGIYDTQGGYNGAGTYGNGGNGGNGSTTDTKPAGNNGNNGIVALAYISPGSGSSTTTFNTGIKTLNISFSSGTIPTVDLCGNFIVSNGDISIASTYLRETVAYTASISQSLSTNYSTPTAFTRAFWYNPTIITGQMNTLSSKNLKMYFNGTSFMTVLFNAVSGTQVSIVDTINRGTGTWTHYAVTYSGTTATLYVNGSSVASNASVTYTGENGAINSGGLCIGDYNGTGVGAIAYFDNIHCYNTAYSSAQILAIYNAEVIFKYNINNANIISYYPLDTNLNNYSSGSIGAAATSIGGAGIVTTNTKLKSGSLYLNSTLSQAIQIPEITLTNNGFTFACWIKFISGGQWARIFDFGNGVRDIYITFSANVLPTLPNIGFRVFSASGGTSDSGDIITSYTIPDTNWHHICVTISNVGLWTLYADGVAYTTNVYSYPNTSPLNNCYIGKSNWPNDPYPTMYLNQVLIFNRTLTSNEVNVLYNYPNQLTITSLPSY